MPIIKTVDFQGFVQTFEAYGRASQYSRAALRVIFDYYEQYSEDTGEPFELDVIAICCDVYEATWQDIASNYHIDLSECKNDNERKDTVLDYLYENTCVLGETDDTIIYQCF